MNDWEWQLLEEKTPLTAVRVSGMDLKLGDTYYESFIEYQKRLTHTLDGMAKEFNFFTIDANKPVEEVFEEIKATLTPILGIKEAPKPDTRILQQEKGKSEGAAEAEHSAPIKAASS